MRWLDPSAMAPKDPVARREDQWLIAFAVFVISYGLLDGYYWQVAAFAAGLVVYSLLVMSHETFLRTAGRVKAPVAEYRRRG